MNVGGIAFAESRSSSYLMLLIVDAFTVVARLLAFRRRD